MTDSPHPDSLVTTPDGRTVYLKVHRCLWSGEYPENSLLAIQECYRERVARAEIDINILRDADFLVTHDPDLNRMTTGTGLVAETTSSEAGRLRFRHAGAISSERPSLLSEVVDAIRAEPFPTMMELDAPDFRPWPWPRVEELARLVEPVKDRIVFGSCADWNLRRLLQVDPTMPVGFNPAYYLDWVPPTEPPEPVPHRRGAYGYLDDHPLALERLDTTANYLRDRLGDLVRLVPGSRELHISLATFERMLNDGLHDVADLFHQAGMLVDVWTLNAGTPRWQERLNRAIAAGVDLVTTDTAHELAASALTPGPRPGPLSLWERAGGEGS